LGADGAAGGETHVRHEDVGPGGGHGASFVRIEDVGGGEQVHLAGEADHLHFKVVAHAGFFETDAHGAIDQANGREVLDPGEPDLLDLFEEDRHLRNGSVPQTPARTGRVLDDRQDLAGHVHDDGVGIAVGHHAGEGAAAGHAESDRSCR
jgi:hypothetical protein